MIDLKLFYSVTILKSLQQPDGGTDMYAGIEAAIKGLDSDRTSSIVLITDGVANLGKTEKKDFLTLMSKHDVRLFTGIMVFQTAMTSWVCL